MVITMKINFKKDVLPFEDFNFKGRSYCREISDIKPNCKNGYGLIGDFVEKKKETELENGKLYISVSRGGDKEITHLFTIENDEPKLLKTSKAQKGAIKSLWSEIEKFIANRPTKSAKQLADMVLSEVSLTNNDLLYEVANLIVSKAQLQDTIHQKVMDECFQRGMRMLQLEKGCYPFQINPHTEIKKETKLGKEFLEYYEEGRYKTGSFIDKWKIHEIHRF